ncbi:hypothetical protein [uncultured Thermanaerothrix sp.]|uniref:hypothetical protein n=1 Tax=uncultured Thermanaerothrix sp. TaxID=1195149 RepID=UPI00263270D4|nr:hypothetical protein [uncultured Thermanaerothrix sp.]
MLSAFWESLGSEVTRRWAPHLLGPGMLFWGVGGVALAQRGYLGPLWAWVNQRSGLEQTLLAAAVVLGLILSATLMQRLRLDWLRLLEGAWPDGLRGLCEALTRRWADRIAREEARYQDLKQAEATLTPRQREELARLEMRLHYVPADPADYRPTRLGNILRTGERDAAYKYGLDALVCWARLWLLLPPEARNDLALARERLEEDVVLWGWGLLSLIWAFFLAPLALISLVWMITAYNLALRSASVYADLIMAAFDLYRHKLYTALGWPLPPAGEAERVYGEKLSEYLWRGTLPE